MIKQTVKSGQYADKEVELLLERDTDYICQNLHPEQNEELVVLIEKSDL